MTEADGGAARVTVYWSFRSPYSYIATPRLLALRESHGVALDWRFVHPAAIRNPARFDRMTRIERDYFLLDSAREAARRGLPFRRPRPDPIDQDPETLAIAAEQPLARRLGRLGIAAARAGRGPEFALEVGRLLWDGATDDWHEGDHLARAAARAGLDPAALEAAVADDPEAHEAALDANDKALRAAGHWGVPVIVHGGEPFFGQDRIATLAWRIETG